MLQPILIFSVVCIACFFYYKFATQKAQLVADNFDSKKAKDNLQNHKQHFLNTDLAYLKKWMKNKPIDTFTEASISISTKKKVKNTAIDTLKSIAWAVIGVKARYQRVETPTFLVLSNDELHFLSANVDGDLDNHIILTKENLENASITFKGNKDGVDLADDISKKLANKLYSDSQKASLPQLFTLEFNIDGKPLAINAHDKIVLPYVVGSKNHAENALIANLIAEEFFIKLAEKYPNLKA